MKILFDENFPSPVMMDFVGHECSHVIALGWQGVQNGSLLAKAELAGFDVLVTFDGSIPKQNNLVGRQISLYILKPEGQGLEATRNLVSDVLVALESYEPGQLQIFTNRKHKPVNTVEQGS